MIDQFLEYLLVEQRYSPHTILSYQRDLQDFAAFHLEKEGEIQIVKAETVQIKNFIYHCGEKNLSKRTINRKLSALRSFFNFLLKIEEIEVSPINNLKSLKNFPEKQTGYSEVEMANLQTNLIQAPLLDQVILELLYQTGMRKAELCNLKVKNVDFKDKQLKFVGKGNKERIIPFTPKFSVLLKEYYDQRQPKVENEDYFLITKQGKRVNEQFIYRRVHKWMQTVTFKTKKNPHSLRHTFANHLLENGAEISEIKELMGHASIASTQVYTSANIEKLKKVFNKAHPRAAKAKKD